MRAPRRPGAGIQVHHADDSPLDAGDEPVILLAVLGEALLPLFLRGEGQLQRAAQRIGLRVQFADGLVVGRLDAPDVDVHRPRSFSQVTTVSMSRERLLMKPCCAGPRSLFGRLTYLMLGTSVPLEPAAERSIGGSNACTMASPSSRTIRIGYGTRRIQYVPSAVLEFSQR